MLLRTRTSAWLTVVLIFLTFSVVVYIRRTPSATLPQIDIPIAPKPIVAAANFTLDSCPKSLDWLKDLSIDFPIKYARRDIIVHPKPGLERASLTKIDEPLFSEGQTIDISDNVNVKLKHCKEPLMLDVPDFPREPVDASHMMFGVATLLDRLDTSIPYFLRWLPYTKARLFIIVEGPDDTEPDTVGMAAMQAKMRGLGMDVKLVKPLDRRDNMPERYFSLVKSMYSHRNEKTKWITIIDDDTFFPAMHALVDVLDKHDHSQEWYIGGMSEEWWSVVRYGMMGFGGAGVFLSIPMAAVLDKNYEDCKRRSGAGAGDLRIVECINWHSSTRLTHIAGLHQIDIHGDRSGLLESGRRLLSFHHWKEGWWDEGGYGTWFPLHAMHYVADVCGDCFLQRWQFGSDMVLSNGYSIATYPTGALKKADMRQAEGTWQDAGLVEDSNNAGWDHYVGPLRPMLQLEKEKIQYRFLDAIVVDGGVKQFYLHLGLNDDLDTLLEIFWITKRASIG